MITAAAKNFSPHSSIFFPEAPSQVAPKVKGHRPKAKSNSIELIFILQMLALKQLTFCPGRDVRAT